MNQALMVVAIKSCSNSFPKLLSIIIIYIYMYICNLNFEIEREREGDISTHDFTFQTC